MKAVIHFFIENKYKSFSNMVVGLIKKCTKYKSGMGNNIQSEPLKTNPLFQNK